MLMLLTFLITGTMKQLMCHSKTCNFDETNVSDQPGAKKVICHKNSKCVERRIDHSKANISLMYSGFAGGSLLPPMVIYKTSHIY